MELVFDLLIALLLVGFIVGGTQISADTVASDLLGAGGFPIIFAIFGLVVLALSYLYRSQVDASPAAETVTRKGLLKAGYIALMLLVYILLVTRIGFIITTVMLAFSVVRIVGFKSNLKGLLFSLFITAILVVIFGKVFYIALPRGLGIIKELSYYIY